VRRVTREQRARGFRDESLPREFRPHALFVGYAPHDRPRYAVAVVVEHGLSGSQAAGPIAREIMMEVLTRDPVGRDAPAPGPRVAEAQEPRR
jgi:penicillin-binding protein 2